MKARELILWTGMLIMIKAVPGQNLTLRKFGDFEGTNQRFLNFVLPAQGLGLNPQVWIYTLDSTLEMVKDSTGVNWIYANAESYGFDEQMRFNKQAQYWYSPEMGQFEPIEKDTMIFRPDGRMDTLYRYYGNVIKMTESGWTLGDYDVYYYAPDTLTVVKYVLNQQGIFVPVNKTVEVYYADGSLKENYFYEADSTGFLWPVSKREYVRSGGLLTQETGYSYYIPWNNWIYNDRTDYVYMGTLNILTWRYVYDWGALQWVNLDKEVNNYDAQGRLISRFNYQWDAISGDYLPSWGFTQSYTINGDPDTLINFISPDQASFIPYVRQIIDYDEVLNPFKMSIWWYDIFSFTWQPIEMQEIIYNNNVLMEQLLWPPFIDSIYMRHMPESVNGYMWDGQTWELYRKMQLFYQYRQFTGLENQRRLSECLWPNPFGDVLHVDGKGYGLLELTDINGRRVMVASLHLPAVVNTSSLPSGVYVYRLQVGGTTRVGKLIRH